MIHMPSDKKAVDRGGVGQGPGRRSRRQAGDRVVQPRAGVRAALQRRGLGKAYLRFEPYTPLAKLLGEGPQIAILDKPFEGKTKDELKALYPKLVGGRPLQPSRDRVGVRQRHHHSRRTRRTARPRAWRSRSRSRLPRVRPRS